MVGDVAARPAHPVDRKVVGETALEGRRRLAMAALVLVTGLTFALPPVVAVLVLAGVIR